MFIDLFSSKPFLPASYASASRPRALCWEMLGCAFLAQPHVTQGMRGLRTPTGRCCHVLIDMQLGKVVRTAHKALSYHPW
jgi:hypothetical protein